MISDNNMNHIGAKFLKKCNIKVHTCKSTTSRCKKCNRCKCYICEGVEECYICKASICYDCITAESIIYCDICNSTICCDCSNVVTCQCCNNKICESCLHLTKACSKCPPTKPVPPVTKIIFYFTNMCKIRQIIYEN